MIMTVWMLLDVPFVGSRVRGPFVWNLIILIRFLKTSRVIWCLLVGNTCILMCVNVWLIDFLLERRNILCIVVIMFIVTFVVCEVRPHFCYMKPCNNFVECESFSFFFYFESKTNSCTRLVSPFIWVVQCVGFVKMLILLMRGWMRWIVVDRSGFVLRVMTWQMNCVNCTQWIAVWCSFYFALAANKEESCNSCDCSEWQ